MSVAAMGVAALRRVARAAARDFEAFALPQRCPACGHPAEPRRLLCERCLAAIPALSFAVCAHCLLRGREPVGCRRHPRAQVWPALVFDERAALLVHALKYGGRPGLAEALGTRLAEALPASLEVDLVTAVPLHSARRRERGYNQAWHLALALAARRGLPAIEDVMTRVRATAAQARLDPSERRRNLAGAFRVPEAVSYRGRRVLVVDDVLTTGATLEACLEALAEAGARPVGAALAWAQ